MKKQLFSLFITCGFILALTSSQATLTRYIRRYHRNNDHGRRVGSGLLGGALTGAAIGGIAGGGRGA
jgi:hypothetical protein